jgi:predicted DNA-binding transcriptional regulator AlpA
MDNSKSQGFIALLTPKEAAGLLKVSLSWLAKARMRGDGPPYIRIGRSIRYTEAALIQWMKERQRMSTSEQLHDLLAQAEDGTDKQISPPDARNNGPSRYI